MKFIIQIQDGPVKKYVNKKLGWTYQRTQAAEFTSRRQAERAIVIMQGGDIVEVDA